MKKKKNSAVEHIKERFTIKTYFIIMFWFVICILSGEILRIYFGSKDSVMVLVFLITAIFIVFIFGKEYYDSIGYKFVLVDKWQKK